MDGNGFQKSASMAAWDYRAWSGIVREIQHANHGTCRGSKRLRHGMAMRFARTVAHHDGRLPEAETFGLARRTRARARETGNQYEEDSRSDYTRYS